MSSLFYSLTNFAPTWYFNFIFMCFNYGKEAQHIDQISLIKLKDSELQQVKFIRFSSSESIRYAVISVFLNMNLQNGLLFPSISSLRLNYNYIIDLFNKFNSIYFFPHSQNIDQCGYMAFQIL